MTLLELLLRLAEPTFLEKANLPTQDVYGNELIAVDFDEHGGPPAIIFTFDNVTVDGR